MTRRIFVQCVDSMSVTRSLITGMFAIGSTTIGRAASSAPPPGAARSPQAVAPVGALVGLADLGLAAERRLPVDLHPARAADRRPARAADDERPVGAVADLEQPVEHREVGVEVDLELLPVRPLARLRLVPPDLQRVLRHLDHPHPSSVRPLRRLPLGDRHRRVADLGPVGVAGDVDVLQPLLVVSLGEVGAVLGAAALGSVQRRDAGALRAVEHEAELDRRRARPG